MPVLAGVVIVVTFLLYGAATKFENDWVAVFACLGVLGISSIVLDRAGRNAAIRHPHPLWYDQRLPYEKSILKNIVVLVVLLIVILSAVETSVETAGTSSYGSPFPYFLAAGFLYLVVPQVFARRIRRRHDADQ